MDMRNPERSLRWALMQVAQDLTGVESTVVNNLLCVAGPPVKRRPAPDACSSSTHC